MSVNYNNTLKTSRMTAVVDAIDAGAGPGVLEICSAGYSLVLLRFEFSDPCGSVAGDPATLTFSGMPKQAVGASVGTAAIARIVDSDSNVIASGLTVGATGSGMNVEIDGLSISAGQIVNLNSGQLVHG